jgi:polyadenylation factor subunit 2
MKEFRILKGHKKEVCCTSVSHLYCLLFLLTSTLPAVTWHPVHPLLVSGGSEGAILHWDLSTPDPASFAQPVSTPRATLSQAHDSNVWSLAYHPLGHLLVSASNDHTTRFWSRERPGDASSVFSGGGEKPPEIIDTSGQDEEDDAMVPGFSYGTGAGPSWWGKDEELTPGFGGGQPTDALGRRPAGYGDTNGDDFIPGFGAAERQAAPQQQDMYGSGERQEDWSRGGGRGGGDDWGRGGNRIGRHGPRGGRY